MAYQANKPVATDQISISQADILNNFIAVGSMLNLSTYPTPGTLSFTSPGVAPATSATQVGLYAAPSVPDPTQISLFFRPQSSGTAIDFTYAVRAGNGWCWLPCGLMLQWGSNTQPGGSNDDNFNFTVTFPTAALSVTGSASAGSTGLNDDILIAISVSSSAQYRVQRKTHFGQPVTFNYFAIGY
jgi:hypothetical protein